VDGEGSRRGCPGGLCLPELYRSRYFCQEENTRPFELAESIPGPTTEAFQKAAEKLNIAIIVPIFEKRSRGLFHNTAVMIDAGGSIAGLYRKMYIPHDPAFYEKYYFTGHVIAGDDTHGHTDDLCRFVNPDTLPICREKNRCNENQKNIEENSERLRKAVLENGSKPRIIDLPMPAPVYFRGMRLPASYANFYIPNTSVLVPTFNDPNDRITLGILAECFPDRKTIGIHSVDLVWVLGTIHRLTHEVPAPAC
jgi:hypothetical protein